MAITEDASTPPPVVGTGGGSTIATARFTPPAGSMLVARVSGEWSSRTCTVNITDSAGGQWILGALATGVTSAGGVAALYFRYLNLAPGQITVTGTFTHLSGGRFLDVRVLNRVDPQQSVATGWSAVSAGSGAGTGLIGLTTNVAGSVVYGISDAPDLTTIFTPNGATTLQQAHNNTPDRTGCASWKATTVTPGPVTLGGTWSPASHGLVAAFEFLPAGTAAAALPPAPTFVDGTVPTAADLNALGLNIERLYDITTGGRRWQSYSPGGKGPIKPLTVLSVTNPNYVLQSGTVTPIRWDTVLANSDNAWSPLDAALLLPNTAGLYRLHLQVQVVSTTAAQLVAQILINGTTVTTNGVATANAYGVAVGCSATVQLAQYAQVYGFVTQNTGANTGVGLLQLAMEYLGP